MRICKSYCENISGTFFIWTRCIFCRAMPTPSRGVRLSVCLSIRLSVSPSRWCILSKRIKHIHIFNFSHHDSHVILVFAYKTLWQYSDEDEDPRITRASNAGWIGKNRDSRRMSVLPHQSNQCKSLFTNIDDKKQRKITTKT